MNIFEVIHSANHNLLRNKARTLLTILAIFIGSFTISLNSAINAGVDAFIDDQIASLGGDDYIMIAPEGSIDAMGGMMGSSSEPREYDPNRTLSALSAEQLEKLKQIDGIDGENLYVAKQIPIEYITSQANDKKYTITVAAMPPGTFSIPMSAGNLPDRDTDEYQIALQPDYPKALGFESDEDAIGKTVDLVIIDPVTEQPITYQAKITGVEAKGVVNIGGSIINPALETTMYDEITKYYPPEQKNLAYVVETRFDTEKYTEDKIKEVLKENGFYGVTVSDLMGTIRTFFDIIMIVFTIFGGIALLAAAIGIINTLLMSVEERTREIGLDKALGMSSGKIFTSFSIEAILLGFWGSALGVGVAILIGNIVNFVVHQPGGFLEVFPTFNLFTFTASGVLPLILIVMLIAFIAGTVPAWKAAHKNPIDALRYE